MTARAETVAPLSFESRVHLLEHRDELREMSKALDVERADLRTDQQRGIPVPDDVLRLVREASDLLLVAARRLDPDHQEARRG